MQLARRASPTGGAPPTRALGECGLRRAAGRGRNWKIAAGLIAVAGILGILVGAQAVAAHDGGDARDPFGVSAATDRLMPRRPASSASFVSARLPAAGLHVTQRLAGNLPLPTHGQGEDLALHRTLPLFVVGSGCLLSICLATVVFLLATGRRRALRMVEDRSDELRRQALHDNLTGLPNRSLVLDRLEQMLARARRNGAEQPAALYVDLDGFRTINDTSGHGVGDELLKTVAARLTAALRGADTVGRMGADEFLVLIEGVSGDSAPEVVAQRLLDVLREPIDVPGAAEPIALTASIGIAVGLREESEHLLRDADVALAEAKAAGRNCYAVFHAAMGSDVRRRYELDADLRTALERNQFRLVYQPIYALDDLRMTGAEALLRWEHPTLGNVGPAEFIPLLETNGRILEVGRWVLREACRQTAAWRALGHDLSVAVNLSSRQLDRDVVVTEVRDALTQSGLDPAALVLEITETAVMQNVEATARRLAELKELGVRVAVDDFGTGYSSLSYLQRLPVDCLKIDRFFTQAMSDSAEAAALVHTLVTLGRTLRLRIVAEGIETAQQMQRLRAEGVDEAQGYLLSRPLEVAILDGRLRPPRRGRARALTVHRPIEPAPGPR